MRSLGKILLVLIGHRVSEYLYRIHVDLEALIVGA